MKSILILHNSLDYNKSGVERVSFLLKKELESRGYNCFEGCVKGENVIHQKNVFEYNFNDSRKVVLTDITTFISRHNIEVIIIQGLFDPNINYAISQVKKTCACKIIFCLHNAPSAYKRKIPLSALNQLKIFIWYLIKFQKLIFDYRNHRLNMLIEMFNITDRFILLSKTYTEELRNIIKKKDLKKVYSISNPLTFKSPRIVLHQKKKQVLILGRLDDFQKNISSALRIWKHVEGSDFHDWKLVIVGSGVDEIKLKEYAKTLSLRNYTFTGETSEPEKYYLESSLFMMTSHIEGWPMTLLEAQQFGCIPIVYNTFAALPEIIENGINGFVIEKNDEFSFAKKITELMGDISLQKELVQNCINKCQAYSSKNIGDKWDALLKNL